MLSIVCPSGRSDIAVRIPQPIRNAHSPHHHPIYLLLSSLSLLSNSFTILIIGCLSRACMSFNTYQTNNQRQTVRRREGGGHESNRLGDVRRSSASYIGIDKVSPHVYLSIYIYLYVCLSVYKQEQDLGHSVSQLTELLHRHQKSLHGSAAQNHLHTHKHRYSTSRVYMW